MPENIQLGFEDSLKINFKHINVKKRELKFVSYDGSLSCTYDRPLDPFFNCLIKVSWEFFLFQVHKKKGKFN